LERHGQGHLLRWWGDLGADGRARLASEVASIDFDQLERLVADLVHCEGGGAPAAEPVEPVEAVRLPQTDGERVVMRRAAGVGAGRGGGGGGGVLGGGGAGAPPGFGGAKGALPDRAGLLGEPVPDPRREDHRAVPPPSPHGPALYYDQPRESSGDRRLLPDER